MRDISKQEEKLNGGLINKGQWIVVGEALIHLKLIGFINLM